MLLGLQSILKTKLFATLVTLKYTIDLEEPINIFTYSLNGLYFINTYIKHKINHNNHAYKQLLDKIVQHLCKRIDFTTI